MKRRTLQLLLLAALSSSGAMAQITCNAGSAASFKLVCEFPFATGVLNNDTALGQGSSTGGGATQGAQSAVQAATTLNIGVATQVSQLPIASASAGAIVVYRNGVQGTVNDLGPILTDRAQTVGKHKFFLGFTASQFVFTSLDGVSLSSLPFSYFRNATNPTTGLLQSTTYTQETTAISFRINQFIAVGTYGLDDKTDFTMIVPVERVSIGSVTPQQTSTSYVVDGNSKLILNSYTNPTSAAAGNATGLGDITFNLKRTLFSGERVAVASAMNIRIPSGDDQNLLGTGAWGFNPYAVISFQSSSPMSPHLKLGYQWNTPTELNDPTLTSSGKQSLPGGMQYDAGVDYAVAKHVTIAADLLGSQFLNTPRLIQSTTQVSTTTGSIPFVTSTPSNSSYTISSVSTGAKWAVYKDFLLSANVLFQITNNGLHARPTPLMGISYKF